MKEIASAHLLVTVVNGEVESVVTVGICDGDICLVLQK